MSSKDNETKVIDVKKTVRVQKIYTKAGDAGLTSLLGSSAKIPKWDRGVKAYGAVDELNAHFGLVREVLADLPRYGESLYNEPGYEQHKRLRSLSADICEDVTTIQRTLFVMSSWLSRATYNSQDTSGLSEIKRESITLLESHIDRMTAELPPLKNFILLCGDGTTSIHVARAVCRRVESATCKAIYDQMAESTEQYVIIMEYFNRLSDWLFTAARYYAAFTGQKEICV